MGEGKLGEANLKCASDVSGRLSDYLKVMRLTMLYSMIENNKGVLTQSAIMRTILEIFYLRIVGDNVLYQRKEANLSGRGSSPDRKIRSLLNEKHSAASGKVKEEEFIVHSTSWRYAKPDKVLLTYVAYSDELEFEKGNFHRLPLKKLKVITRRSRKPRSRAELEKKVVSHALRHIAFLIRTGDQGDFRKALSPETIKVFKSLWVSLAGKVF